MEKRDERNYLALEDEQSFGPIFAIFIIVILLILGALFILRDAVSDKAFPGRSLAPKDPVVKQLSEQGTSDEATDIRRDLAATSIQSLYQGLGPLEEEFR